MKEGLVAALEKRLKALADPTRMKLLAMLERRPRCVCELTAALSLAQPTVSRHLRCLEDAGFLAKERRGSWVVYSLEPSDDLSRELLGLLLSRLGGDLEVQMLVKRLEASPAYLEGGGAACGKMGAGE